MHRRIELRCIGKSIHLVDDMLGHELQTLKKILSISHTQSFKSIEFSRKIMYYST
jgi:hypoxanthine-guanine phosphoribosyltransferase